MSTWKIVLLVVLAVLASAGAGLGLGWGGVLLLPPWLLGFAVGVVVYIISAVVRPKVMSKRSVPAGVGSDPFATAAAMMAKMVDDALGCLPVLGLTLLFWIGCVVGTCIGEDFVATATVNLIWPVATLLILVMETKVMERMSARRVGR